MLKARAIAGTHVVVLAWDLMPGQKSKLDGLLGYAIERTELDLAGDEVERYWMRGIKRFKDKDKGLPPGTPVSTAEHPIQASSGPTTPPRRARATGSGSSRCTARPRIRKLDDAAAVTLDVTTEKEGDQPPARPTRASGTISSSIAA